MAEPQIYIAKYLRRMQDERLLQFLEGPKADDDALNARLTGLLADPRVKLPKITINVGAGSYHYEEHVAPFLEAAVSAGKGESVRLDICPYSEHGDAIYYYHPLLMREITDAFPELKDTFVLNNIVVEQDGSRFRATIDSPLGVKFGWYVFHNGERILVLQYDEKNRTLEYEAENPGDYRFSGFVIDEKGEVRSLSSGIYRVGAV